MSTRPSSKGCKPIDEVVKQLNWYLVGWSNYFGTGHPTKTFRLLNLHVFRRMWQFLQRKSQRPFKPPDGMSWYKLIFDKLKEHRLTARLACKPCGECIHVRRMGEIHMSGGRRGEEAERNGMRLVRHRRGNPETELCRNLKQTVTLSTRQEISRAALPAMSKRL